MAGPGTLFLLGEAQLKGSSLLLSSRHPFLSCRLVQDYVQDRMKRFHQKRQSLLKSLRGRTASSVMKACQNKFKENRIPILFWSCPALMLKLVACSNALVVAGSMAK